MQRLTSSCLVKKQKDEERFPEFRVGTELVVLKEGGEDADAISSLVVVEFDTVDLESPLSTGLSQNERITLEAIVNLGKPTVETKEIIAAVSAKRGKESTSSVKNTWLPKLIEKGLVERVSEGIYRLPGLDTGAADDDCQAHKDAA